jgi:hypothetical protein
MKSNQTFLLALLGAGALLAIIQFLRNSMRAQVNRRLLPDQQITAKEVQNPYKLFVEGGLLARHTSLYPKSHLVTAFRLLWGIFWVLMAVLITRS